MMNQWLSNSEAFHGLLLQKKSNHFSVVRIFGPVKYHHFEMSNYAILRMVDSTVSENLILSITFCFVGLSMKLAVFSSCAVVMPDTAAT